MDVFAHFPGNYDEEERDDGRVEDPYAAGGDDRGGDGRRGEGGGGYDDGYTYGRTRDPCEGVDCPPVYWDGTPPSSLLPPSITTMDNPMYKISSNEPEQSNCPTTCPKNVISKTKSAN